MNKTNDELIMDYISGQLCTEDKVMFEHNLQTNPKLKKEWHESLKAYELFQSYEEIVVPEAPLSMDKNFYSMLAFEKNKQTETKESWIKTLFGYKWINFLVYGAAMMFLGGLSVHFYALNNALSTLPTNSLLAQQYSNKMQELAVVSMLQLPSASKRLQAVSLVENADTADDVVISALFNTLNNDSNTNVRLAVLDTLVQFANTPEVRGQLVNSITNQNSPMVQVAIAELMLHLQETKAIKPLKKLLENKDLIEPAREKILFAVNEII